MRKKAQATLEFSLIFIISTVLLAGLLGLWKWSSDSIIKRQKDYNASRVEKGSTPNPASSSEAAIESALDNAEASINSLNGIGDLSALSADQLNSNLDSVNNTISSLQSNQPAIIAYGTACQNSLNAIQEQESASQAEVDRLNSLLDATTDPVERNRLTIELEKAQYGYYTTITTEYRADGSSFQVTTYEYTTESGHYTVREFVDENGQTNLVKTASSGDVRWASTFDSRAAWAQDYWTYSQYGVSEGNNVYGLYANYTPGLLDWQARVTYAQEQNNQAQSNVSQTSSALTSLTGLRDNLQAAIDSQAAS